MVAVYLFLSCISFAPQETDAQLTQSQEVATVNYLKKSSRVRYRYVTFARFHR
jgi:hypothetical protein